MNEIENETMKIVAVKCYAFKEFTMRIIATVQFTDDTRQWH